jgi:hypothetical protein
MISPHSKRVGHTMRSYRFDPLQRLEETGDFNNNQDFLVVRSFGIATCHTCENAKINI